MVGKPKHIFCFESYGTNVRLVSNSAEILTKAIEVARTALLGKLKEIDCNSVCQVMELRAMSKGNCSVWQNGKRITSGRPGIRFWKFVNALVRVLVGEHSKSFVFLHAGVVGWRGKAIVIPGNSYAGKTTLVAELVKCGAEYYSDEYALIDDKGRIHPFSRPLSIRSDSRPARETVATVADLGGVNGETPISLGCAVVTKFEVDAVWRPQILTLGQGILEIIPHTLSVSRHTDFAIKVLKIALGNAIIAKSPRPGAKNFAPIFLEFVDNTTF